LDWGVFVLVLALYFSRTPHQFGWVAGIATLWYQVKPHSCSFDADFSYESLAIPLAFRPVCLARRPSMGSWSYPEVKLATWVGLGAVVITHNITSYAQWYSSFSGRCISYKTSFCVNRLGTNSDFSVSLSQRHGRLSSKSRRKLKVQAGSVGRRHLLA